MYTLNGFLDACKITEIQLVKGEGREFATTPIGKVWAAAGIDWNKTVFVLMAGPEMKSKTGASLAGTFWFCNSKVQISRTLKRQ
jgi:hypothetical protein